MSWLPLVTVILIATLSGTAGVYLESTPSLARRLVPFGAGALVGIALGWVLPEIAAASGWLAALGWIVGGVALLAAIDRWVYPVCPVCSPAHGHDHCGTTLHGFAGPLLVAASLHSALDGWSLFAAGDAKLGWGFLAGIALHKIPEGAALGVITRAALPSAWQAILWVAVSQTATLVGAAAEATVALNANAAALHIPLALAAGSFLYLGWHAIHGEVRNHGARFTLVPALAGIAGSGMLRIFLR